MPIMAETAILTPPEAIQTPKTVKSGLIRIPRKPVDKSGDNLEN
jgi:hypothetical protein